MTRELERAIEAMAVTWTEDTLRPQRAAVHTRLELLRRAALQRPDLARVHYDLALAHAEVEDFASCSASFEQAMALEAPEPRALVPYLKALGALGKHTLSLELLAAHAQAVRGSAALLSCRGAAHAARGDQEAALHDLHEALRLEPRHDEALHHLTRLLTRAQDWSGLLALVRQHQETGHLTGTLVRALLTSLIGLGRKDEARPWVDFDAMVSVTAMSPPAPYLHLAAFHAALEEEVRSPHRIRLRDVPRLKMSGGVQVEDLETGSSPALAALLAALRAAVEHYITSATGARRTMLDAMLRPPLSMSPWALMLEGEDTQDRHYHLHATLGGVYYVAAPTEALRAGSHAGSLVIPCEAAVAGTGREHFIAPQPGRVVLFPGYLYHRTTPTKHASTRLSIAFNIISTAP